MPLPKRVSNRLFIDVYRCLLFCSHSYRFQQTVVIAGQLNRAGANSHQSKVSKTIDSRHVIQDERYIRDLTYGQ